MSSDITPANEGVAGLAGDACLLAAVTIPLGPLALIIGPIASWLLHGRSVNKRAAIGLVIGLVAGTVVVGAFMAVLALGLSAANFGGDSQNTIPLVLFGIVAVGFVAAMIALDVDAIRDLVPARRVHLRLDVVRLVATAILLAGGVAIFLAQRANPGSEVADAAVFAVLSGATAAVATYVAWKYTDRSMGVTA